MRASARIVARCQPDGSTRLTTLSGEAPLLLRRGGVRGRTAAAIGAPDFAPPGSVHGGPAHPDGADAPFELAHVDRVRPDGAGRAAAQVHLVGGAAGPLGGDELRCLVDLGPGARLDVRGVASSIALPGPNGRESTLEIHARISESAALAWSPPPLIAARGARHRTVARVELEPDSRLVWRDELLLGREGEEPGSVSTRLRVTRAGRVLLDREIALGPRHAGSLGPAGSGGHRALGAVLIVEPGWDDSSRVTPATTARSSRQPPGYPQVATQDDPGLSIAVLRLPGPAVLITAAAADGHALSRVLDAALPG